MDGREPYWDYMFCLYEVMQDINMGIMKFRTEMNYDWVLIMDDKDPPNADMICYGIGQWQEETCLQAGCCRYSYDYGYCEPMDGFWSLPCIDPEDAHSGPWCGRYQDYETCDEEKFAVTQGQYIRWSSDNMIGDIGFKICPMIITCNAPAFPEFGDAVYCPNSPPQENDVCLLSCASGYRADPPEAVCIENDNWIMGRCVPCKDEPESFEVEACSSYDAIPSGSSLAFVDALVDSSGERQKALHAIKDKQSKFMEYSEGAALAFRV
jgi:hypothetical protein